MADQKWEDVFSSIAFWPHYPPIFETLKVLPKWNQGWCDAAMWCWSTDLRSVWSFNNSFAPIKIWLWYRQSQKNSRHRRFVCAIGETLQPGSTSQYLDEIVHQDIAGRQAWPGFAALPGGTKNNDNVWSWSSWETCNFMKKEQQPILSRTKIVSMLAFLS